MPSIKISNGVVSYKTHPLFLGIKKIDKDIAAENLLLLKEFLDKKSITFGLIAGTLLGAVREKDFISHDEDIDLFFLEEQRCSLLDLLPQMKKIGFEVARYDRRGLLSIIRKGEYIDLYFFKKLSEGIRHCCGWCIPEAFLLKTTTIDFKGKSYVVPFDYVNYLVYQYGNNWQTPIKYVDFEMPRWKRRLYEWKEFLKEIAPDFIFYYIAKKSEVKMLKKYEVYIARYNEMYNAVLRIPV